MAKKIHFIGIGGIGMSGLAQLCLTKGYEVTGSDMYESDNTRRLTQLGAQVYFGHRAQYIADQDMVVYSTAIKPDNPEYKEAKKRKLRLLRRAELLADLMKSRRVITITGAHGKTTTSSLASHLLMEAGLSPTSVVGGVVKNIATNAKLGTGEYFVAEADESDGTFLCYKPTYSIITNVDHEHLDFYKNFDEIKKAFVQFAFNTKKDGRIIWCYEDRVLASLLKEVDRKTVSYGFDQKALVWASNIKLSSFGSQFDAHFKDITIDTFTLSIPGEHNVLNALAVISLGLELSIDIEVIKKALASFLGVKRRFQVIYDEDETLFIDDYAHHPTEIRATLKAAEQLGKNRIVVVFQPHRYSRLHFLMKQFATCFASADHLFITDVYSASEDNIYGQDAHTLFDLMEKCAKPKTELLPKKDIADTVQRFMKKGDVILFLGAGDINKIAFQLAEDLKGKK